jgi:hypothetical protein
MMVVLALHWDVIAGSVAKTGLVAAVAAVVGLLEAAVECASLVPFMIVTQQSLPMAILGLVVMESGSVAVVVTMAAAGSAVMQDMA